MDAAAVNFADTLKSSIDIAQVVSEYIRLQKSGSTYKARCPFHQEKTPSFHVNPARQSFKCFGCGKGGTAIDFVMEIEGLSFWEACKHLAERYGIPLPKRSDPADAQTRERAGVFEAQEIAFRAYQSALASAAGAEAREYLKRRGVAGGTAEEFGLGYAERGGQMMARLLERAGVPAAMMEATGLVLRRNDGSGYFDRFRNRLIFPIHNETGKLIGFAGRALSDEDQPKYLNSPETAIYHKSHVLYNLHRARKPIRQREAGILVEGYMDVIGLHKAGVQNAIASCGTALTPQQVRMLKRHSDQVVVNFDPDAAGTNAAERSIQVLLEEDMRIRVLELGGGLDPDEYVAAHGSEGYEQALAKAPRYFHWLADRARAKFDMRSAEGRVSGLRFLLPAVQRIADKLERAAIANDVASYLGVDPSMVLEQFRKAAVERGEATVRAQVTAAPASERLLIRYLLDSAAVRRELRGRLEELLRGGRPPQAAAILEAILSAGEPLDYAAVEGRLANEDRTLLSLIAFADGKEEEEDQMLAQAEACVRSLETAGEDARKSEMKARIRDAERSGDMDAAIRLMSELALLEQKR